MSGAQQALVLLRMVLTRRGAPAAVPELWAFAQGTPKLGVGWGPACEGKAGPGQRVGAFSSGTFPDGAGRHPPVSQGCAAFPSRVLQTSSIMKNFRHAQKWTPRSPCTCHHSTSVGIRPRPSRWPCFPFLCCRFSKQIPDIMSLHLSVLQCVFQKKSAAILRARRGQRGP